MEERDFYFINTTGLKSSEREMSQHLLLLQGHPSPHSSWSYSCSSSRLLRVLFNEGKARAEEESGFDSCLAFSRQSVR